MPHRQLDADAWWTQAVRDLRAAEHAAQGGFAPHAVAFAHLAVEKALKAALHSATGRTPPVTHSLTVLADRVETAAHDTDALWPADLAEALDALSGLDVSLLYEPDAVFRRRLPERFADARQAVADARALTDWVCRHLLPDFDAGGVSSGES